MSEICHFSETTGIIMKSFVNGAKHNNYRHHHRRTVNALASKSQNAGSGLVDKWCQKSKSSQGDETRIGLLVVPVVLV